MTENEIIKAIWHCLTDLDCLDCPYVDYEGKERCDEKVLNDLCDLIKRQKAEIERLKSPAVMQIEVSKKIEKSIKAEAVKEVIETMKPWYEFLCVDKGDWCEQLDTHAYNLVKEMVGEG